MTWNRIVPECHKEKEIDASMPSSIDWRWLKCIDEHCLVEEVMNCIPPTINGTAHMWDQLNCSLFLATFSFISWNEKKTIFSFENTSNEGLTDKDSEIIILYWLSIERISKHETYNLNSINYPLLNIPKTNRWRIVCIETTSSERQNHQVQLMQDTEERYHF